MNTIEELKQAIVNKDVLIWNDPEPIPGNDYTISFIEELPDDLDNYEPILIQYNNGGSEAQVFLHEILKQQS